MIRFSFRGVMLLSGVALSCSMLGAENASAQPWQAADGQAHDGPPVYQQHAFDGHRRDEKRDRRDFRRGTRFVSPQISAGSFQRPYPYHLDYYKMRYGGSYAPYFGNLYGTPQVVNYPPYYGPYYGGNGNGYGQPGNNGGFPIEYPANPGMMSGTEVEESAPITMGDEALPAPTPKP